jgi:hypothetical protein
MANWSSRESRGEGPDVSAQNGVLNLHMFESGTVKCHVENIKMNQDLGEEYEIPVPWFLIEHPEKHWGAATQV